MIIIIFREQRRMIEQERHTQKVLSENKQCTSCGKSFLSDEGASCPACKYLVCSQCQQKMEETPGSSCSVCSKERQVLYYDSVLWTTATYNIIVIIISPLWITACNQWSGHSVPSFKRMWTSLRLAPIVKVRAQLSTKDVPFDVAEISCTSNRVHALHLVIVRCGYKHFFWRQTLQMEKAFLAFINNYFVNTSNRYHSESPRRFKMRDRNDGNKMELTGV